MIKSQATTTEKSQISVSQQYRWHMIIKAEWEDLQRENSPCDIFTRFDRYLQFNLDETCFLCNEGELKDFGRKDKPHHKQMESLKVFNKSPLGWEYSRCEWSSEISGKGDKVTP